MARSFQGNEAQRIVDFLDRVSNLCFSYPSSLRCRAQVLEGLLLDDKLRQRGLRLLSKICKAHGIIPTSYILQEELIHVGRVHCYGGSADVSDGKYSGRPVAIKHLKVTEEDTGGIYKVYLVDLVHCHHSALNTWLSTSTYAKRSSVGNICPIPTSCPC